MKCFLWCPLAGNTLLFWQEVVFLSQEIRCVKLCPSSSCPSSVPCYQQFLCPLFLSSRKNKNMVRFHCLHVNALSLDIYVSSLMALCTSLFPVLWFLACIGFLHATNSTFVLILKSWWHRLKCRLANLMFIQD